MSKKIAIHGKGRPRNAGFSLVELSIVVVITAILLTMGITALTVQSENAAFSATRNRQQLIGEALSGYFARNGRLPCPDLPTAAGNVIGRGDDNRATVDDVTTKCASDIGVLPYIDLGIPRDAVLDGWENFYAYRVTTDAGVDLDWARSSAAIIPGKPAKLVVSERSPASSAVLTKASGPLNAVYVLVSHGRNGLGATTVQGTTNSAPAAATDEALNAAGGATVDGFIRRDVTAVDAGYGAYDDIVAFATAEQLVSPLVKDGSVRSATGATQKALSDFVDLVIGQSIPTATLPAQPTLPSIDQGKDGWGMPIVYRRVESSAISATSPVAGGVAFTVTSYGQDRVAGGTDDIVSTVTVDTLRTLYTKSGTLPKSATPAP